MGVVENKEKYNLLLKLILFLIIILYNLILFYQYLKRGGETTWVLMTEETPTGEETITAEVLEHLEKCTR